MNIIYHFRVRGTGAEGVHIAGIVNGFRSFGHEVRLVSPTNADPTVSNAANTGSSKESRSFINRICMQTLHFLADSLPQVLFEIMELAYNLVAVARLTRQIIRQRPDFIFERCAFFNFSGAFVAGLIRVPFVVEVNELSGYERVRGQCFTGLARIIEKYIFKRASLIVVVSDFLKTAIEEMTGKTGRIITIPNGVPRYWLAFEPDKERVHKIRDQYGLNDKRVVCFVGGLVHWHNFDLLLDAFASIQKDIHETVLMIVGDGPMKQYIITKAQDLGIDSGSLIFTGNVSHREIPLYLSIATTAIIPETNEYRSPIKLFEYMSMGIPVVAPGMSSIEVVITHGKDGLLFKPGDRAECRQMLYAMLSDKNYAEEIGKAAKEQMNNFTWEQNSKKILDFITGLKN
jgi:glycosyltransferase involved in cell wall biosynthesis